jgi:hypothetical protein
LQFITIKLQLFVLKFIFQLFVLKLFIFFQLKLFQQLILLFKLIQFFFQREL